MLLYLVSTILYKREKREKYIEKMRTITIDIENAVKDKCFRELPSNTPNTVQKPNIRKESSHNIKNVQRGW